MTEEKPDSTPFNVEEFEKRQLSPEAIEQLRQDVAARKEKGRTAEDYLKVILGNSDYIMNVAAVLEKASKRMESTTTYTQIQQKTGEKRDLSNYESDFYNALLNASHSADALLDGLEVAEQLMTGSNGKLESIHPIVELYSAAQEAKHALEYMVKQGAPLTHKLPHETIIAAQAALDVINTKLLPGISVDNRRRMASVLDQYNNTYYQRMAAAQRDIKGGREAGYKQRLADQLTGYQDRSAKREERRTGVSPDSFVTSLEKQQSEETGQQR